MKCLTVKELIAAAEAGPALSLPDETHQSFPIPVQLSDGFAIAFLFCPSSVTLQDGLQLWPPEYVAELSLADGRLLRLRQVTPADFGRSDAPERLLGRYDMLPDGRTPEQYNKLHARLLAAYDQLLPAFTDGLGWFARAHEPARDLRTLFPEVTEQPLQPYYQFLGRAFFSWLERAAL